MGITNPFKNQRGMASTEFYDRWLQCEFAANLAARLLADAKAPRASMIKRCYNEGIFAKEIGIYTEFYWGTKEPRKLLCSKVRASSQLLSVISQVPANHLLSPANLLFQACADPIQTLESLIRACFEESHLMFNGLWNAESLLVDCDYNLDKAFVRAVIAASLWLGPDLFPNGLFEDWPPTPPAGCLEAPVFWRRPYRPLGCGVRKSSPTQEIRAAIFQGTCGA